MLFAVVAEQSSALELAREKTSEAEEFACLSAVQHWAARPVVLESAGLVSDA